MGSRRPRRRAGRCAAAALGIGGSALLGLSGAAAGAAVRPSPSSSRTDHPPLSIHAGQTWSGYAVTGSAPYRSVTGSWNIPTMNCAKGSGDASPWIGIDGYNDATVEQIGVDLDCRSGVPSYHPWVEMYPKGSEYFVEMIRAGDTFTASVTVSGPSWTLTESDTTQGWTKTFHKSGTYQELDAEAIIEDIGNAAVPDVPDFGTVTFSGVTVDGKALAAAGTPHGLNLERGVTPLSSRTPLHAGTFSITWLHP